MLYRSVLAIAAMAGPCLAAASASRTNETVQTYWNDSGARKGLYVERAKDDPNREPTIFLAGRKYRDIGMNCYDLFNCALKFTDDGLRIDLSDSFATLELLKKEGIGLIRFNCGIYYSAELGASYMTDRDAYIDALRQIAARAQELEIGLIPCLMWHYAAVPEYFGEPLRSWGKPGSKTAEFLKAYTTDIVTSLREYKSIFAWEFGNEFNLHADLPQYAQRHTQADPPDWRDVFGTEDPAWRIRGKDILYAYRTFTRIVRRLDPDRRMLLSGNAILRETQYNQYTRDRMTIDDTKQYRKISRILNPGPIETVSEHVYQHGRQFADLGKVSLDEQIAIAVETARSLGKVYVMGEFGAIRGSREEYVPFFEAFLKAGVQLSLFWNFSLRGNIEQSCTPTERGPYIFELIREYKQKDAAMHGE